MLSKIEIFERFVRLEDRDKQHYAKIREKLEKSFRIM